MKITWNLKVLFAIGIFFSAPVAFAAKVDFCSVCKLQSHTGHRGGGDPKFCSYPENSMTALKSFAVCGDDTKKKYLEFDINTTRDGELIVFHGPQLKKMIEFEENEAIFAQIGVSTKKQFKKLNTFDLDYAFLKQLKLKGIGSERIPLLDDYFLAYAQFGLKILIVPDLKFVHHTQIDLLFDKLFDFKQLHQEEVKPYATSTRWRKLGQEGRERVCQNLKKYAGSFNTKDFKNRCDLKK